MTLPIYITEQDARRLRALTQSASAREAVGAQSLNRLNSELDRAKIVPESELPPDAITMNSTAELEDLDDGEIFSFTLVFPENADAANGKISILAPLGMAMLGYRVGNEFEWPVPNGTIRVRVRRLLGQRVPATVPA